ncbi:IS110 family transposase (plasmid) [Alicyclobacillus fastidiosus]|uniref:IS110 family transposase n=1 Tax=Alicyclobacillus fastidiosus TaxID=392011 RepID=A0ABY6ZJ92_9BACL|nr:IS110 family transposase [Alicyclobacillus fastidiosus]WAH42962.1 IS110 family transposase [Alicyclobacillus fastidiosus]WAH44971.1 IS110 family transposase [Alicyclobacillus fastidiosus]GMA64926.1 IS110 family transposase [Alicyclobacillus fastidiosus]GMA66210.1 IS110 family transposase [Alicyclobacillus fastidiosus]GMA66245.1 IS110 family transposase [Alicyclobacillus fastidiosus]
MKTTTKFVGLDVSKEKIAVAVADEGRKDSRFVGMIPHTVEAIRNLVRQLGDEDVQLEFCYEAGPTGYGLYRLLHAMDLSCTVIAPSLIPIRQGDRVKTDKRDALRLAQLFRAGELTSVFVPSEENESLRDLVRAREDAIEDRLRARHQLSKFLLRHDRRPQTKLRAWGKMYERWLDGLSWTDRREQVVFQEYRHHLQEIDGRVSRLEAAIHLEATESERAPVIQALQTLRGVAEVVATSLVAEIGEFKRFRNPKQLMAYAGLVPREYSSGSSRWQGGITKTGNSHLRRVLGEAAWCYRYKPAVKRAIKKRQEGQSPKVQDIAWRAQDRLHRKYTRMVSRGKHHNVAVTSVSRELLGFIWAIACEVENAMETSQAM